MRNLLDHPTHKIEDRKRILDRIYWALLNDPTALTSFKGGFSAPSADELANWAARETVVALFRNL